MRGALPLERLRLRAQPQHLFALGLHLRLRNEVVGAQRLEAREALLRQREAFAMQRGLGVHLYELAAHVAELLLMRSRAAR